MKDHPSGRWIPADNAIYVHAEKTFRTPMGWGIAAFEDKKAAAVYGATLDLNGILKEVK